MSPCSGRSPLWTSGTDWCLTTWTRLRRTEAGTCIRSSLSILRPGTSYWLTLPRLKATTSASLSSSFPCSNLSPRAGRILDQLPGTAGSVSEPCSLGPWDAERAEGVGRRRGFALQAAELSREEVQLQRPCFPLLAQHPCDR